MLNVLYSEVHIYLLGSCQWFKPWSVLRVVSFKDSSGGDCQNNYHDIDINITQANKKDGKVCLFPKPRGASKKFNVHSEDEDRLYEANMKGIIQSNLYYTVMCVILIIKCILLCTIIMQCSWKE